MNKKKLIILISIIITLAILVCVGVFAMSGSKKAKIADKLDLGEKYLEELKYEKALAAYKEVLKIDPKNVDAYLGIVDTYVAMGEYEKALKYAEEAYEETGEDIFAERIEEIEALSSAGTHEAESEDIVRVEDIIWYTEATRDDVPLDMLEKVPDSSVTYVAVGGYGNPDPMGAHFQNYAVGANANPKEGYRYVRCESDTIEFYEYDYNESLGYEVPWFLVPESGHHYIYLYYEPITGSSQSTAEPQVTPVPEIEDFDELPDDYVIDWIDPNLEARMRDITGIYDRDIVYGDVKDITELNLIWGSSMYDEEDKIRDISALGNLTNLTYLSLNFNQIEDISALSSLTNLYYLSLTGNDISDINALGDLTNLERLYLDCLYTDIDDISVLSNLTNLEKLHLCFPLLSDISALSNLTNLNELKINASQISDISVLSSLTQLTDLNLSSNQIIDISALSNLVNLQALWISFNEISDISPLSGLTNLTELHISYNEISDISPLSGLTNLTELDLKANEIIDYSPVSHVPNVSY